MRVLGIDILMIVGKIGVNRKDI